MENKKIVLQNLIKSTTLSRRELTEVVIKTLKVSRDMILLKDLKNKIINGDLNDLREIEIDNLISNLNSYSKQPEVIKSPKVDSPANQDSKNYAINYKDINAITTETKQPETNIDIEERLQELEMQNKILKSKLKLTGTQLIEVSDEDIDNLYIKYLTQGIKKYGKAIIVNGIIPKSYYIVEDQEGEQK